MLSYICCMMRQQGSCNLVNMNHGQFVCSANDVIFYVTSIQQPSLFENDP